MPSTPLTRLFRADGWRKGETGEEETNAGCGEKQEDPRAFLESGHSPQILEGMGHGAGGDGAPQPRELPVA